MKKLILAFLLAFIGFMSYAQDFMAVQLDVMAKKPDDAIKELNKKYGLPLIRSDNFRTLTNIIEIFLATTELCIESGNVYIETKRNVDPYIAFLMHPCVVVWRENQD